jgi:protein MpaA
MVGIIGGAGAQAPTVRETSAVYGHSAQNRPLTAYILGNGANTTLIFGDFHGDERNTPGVVENLRTYLKQHPAELTGRRVILVPYANPDGWNARTRVNAHKVDINRNFPYGWKPVGRADRYNPGPSAASEPETKAIMSLLQTYHPNKIVSIHCPLHLLNWDGEDGKRIAAVMHPKNNYTVKGYIGYPTPGSFGDYCSKQVKIGLVTLELADTSVDKAWQENREALLAAIHLDLSPK